MQSLDIIAEYRKLIIDLPLRIKESGLKDKAIYEKLEMGKGTFYERIRKGRWSIGELEKIYELLGRVRG